MKKRAVLSCVLAGAILLTACSSDNGKRNRSRHDDDDDSGSGFVRETEPTEEAETTVTEETHPVETTETSAAPAVPTVSDEVRAAAYADYLTIIEDNEDAIRAYNWMATVAPDSGVMAPSEEVPLALYDVTGDGLEELFLMKTETTYNADLEVYSYDPASGTSNLILSLEGFDVLAGGGGRYAIAPMDPGFLFVFRGEGDEEWTDSYSVYQFNGSEMYLSGNITKVSHPNDDYTEYVSDYSMNDAAIDEDDFEEAKAEVYEYIEALLQYNYLSQPDMVYALSDVDTYAMSYDDMHDLLSGAL